MKRSTLILIGILILCLAILGTILYIVYDNADVFTGDRIKNPDSYSIVFTAMNQKDSHTLTLKAGDRLAVDFKIDQGKVDLVIEKENGQAIYTGNRISSGIFDVTAPQDGDYCIEVTAKHAAGQIMIHAIESDGSKE